jgi:NADP-dependent 3-hydroxy acid dehydrogenase YdfG
MISLKNKTVLITGASAGIGKACAYAFAKEGANIIIGARRVERLEKIKKEIEDKYSVKVLAIKLDVANREEVVKSIAGLNDDWKNIDILVNNAGLGRGLNKLYEDNPEGWDEMIDTNVKGLLIVTKEVVKGMIERKDGHVINIGSIAGHQAYPGGSVYCATKHAVRAITESLRMETLEHKIRVSTVDPGMVETEFSDVRFYGDKEKAKNVYKGLKPLTGDDIAETVLFCATRPKHVNINEIIVMPSAQATAMIAHRE